MSNAWKFFIGVTIALPAVFLVLFTLSLSKAPPIVALGAALLSVMAFAIWRPWRPAYKSASVPSGLNALERNSVRRAFKITSLVAGAIALVEVAFIIHNPTWKASRTQQGPLPVDHSTPYVSPRERIKVLPKLDQLGGDGFRFVAEAFKSQRIYALAVSKPEGVASAQGVLVVLDREKARGQSYQFEISSGEYDRLMKRLDRTIDWWIGEGINCLDGTSVAFERVRGTRVVSGEGNAGCSEHYGDISAIAFELAKPARSLANPPLDFRWRP